MHPTPKEMKAGVAASLMVVIVCDIPKGVWGAERQLRSLLTLVAVLVINLTTPGINENPKMVGYARGIFD